MLKTALKVIICLRVRTLATQNVFRHSSLIANSIGVCRRIEPPNLAGLGKMSCGTNSCCGFSKDELKERLTLTQYQVTQEKDTERAFSGKYLRHEEKGTYSCVVCNNPLFSSKAKFPSPCGWPAFSDVIDSSKVKVTPDLSHDMVRHEVSCAKCNAHMGHVFDDGPKPTGKRYCINSASLDFQKDDDQDNTTNSA